MAAARAFYRYVCKRSSTFALGIVISTFFFERGFDHICEYVFERYNEGRLWMHIKDKYEVSENIGKETVPNYRNLSQEDGNHQHKIDSAEKRKTD